MAFGIERLRQAVDTLTEHVKTLGESLGVGITDPRNLTLDAVTNTRGDLATRIDSTRGDLSNRIDATHSNIDNLTRDLGAARREISDLHALIQTWRVEAAEARASTPQAPEPATPAVADQLVPDLQPHSTTNTPESPRQDRSASEDQEKKHRDLMLTAAGISRAEFTCHRDLWSFFLRKAANEPHFHIPGEVREGDGKIHATLSGPTLLATLTAMWEVRRQARGGEPSSGDWALSHELYEAVAAAIDTVRDIPRHRDQRKVAIVIDRQPGGGELQQ